MFSFPMLKTGEILQCLRELEISISEEELVECEKHREGIRGATERLVELCMGVGRCRGTSVAEGLEYPEIYEDALVEVGVFRNAASMMRACGVSDYGLRDWLWPNARRTRRNLSAIINFAKFREEELAAYAGLCEARDEKLAATAAAKEAAERAAAETRSVEFQTSDERDEARNASVDCGCLDAEIADLEAELGNLDRRAVDLEAVAREAEAAAVVDRNVRKPDRIDSPNDAALRLADDVEGLRERLRCERGEVSRLERALEEARYDGALAVDDVVDARRAVEDIEQRINEHKAAIKDLKAARATAADLQLEIEDMARDADVVHAKARATDDRATRVKTESARRSRLDIEGIAALRDDIAHLQKERDRLEAAALDLDARHAAATAQLRTRTDLDDTELAWLRAAANDLALLLKQRRAPDVLLLCATHHHKPDDDDLVPQHQERPGDVRSAPLLLAANDDDDDDDDGQHHHRGGDLAAAEIDRHHHSAPHRKRLSFTNADDDHY
ncbi:hypothetical protein CTAYLR_001402 [Chrysophaeum taylorii]|uniref:Kinetochore protein Nuf2 N-terminal domain-containing protein n=1 Tax=Chrysophaeum taylorii TaxID=2483200 RepID=A0AAD7UB64_9STRA|nr:hypothetical protein CTAYLR_001402 [Chrysophaeum taylorii]